MKTFKPWFDWLVTQSHRPRPEFLTAHEPQLKPLAQAGEQRRPVARQDGLHDKLVLIDQSQIRQGQRELHASHEQAFAWLPLELVTAWPCNSSSAIIIR
jgi:hypothetical protein